MTLIPLDSGMKAAFQQIKDGTAFNRSFEDTVGSVTGQITAVQTKIGTIPPQINGVSDSVLSKATNVDTQITNVVNRMPQFADHIKGQFDNIMGNISTFASSQGLKNALAGKSGGCSNMSDFFGSITTKGPQLIGQVSDLANSVMQEVDNFKSLGTDLQDNIAATKSEILNQLNAEIGGAGNDVQRLADLNALKDTVTNQFGSGVAEVRADIAEAVQAQLQDQGRALLDPIVRDMRAKDFALLDSAGKINNAITDIDAHSADLHGLIDSETSALTGAVDELETLGAATGMRSLLNTNPCVQTLMGFVGNDSFLRNLGGNA